MWRRSERGMNAGMNIVMISPGYPAEMAYFTRALAAIGATVIGVGDQPPSALPEAARGALAHYEQVTLTDEGAVLGALHGLAHHVSIDQVEFGSFALYTPITSKGYSPIVTISPIGSR